MSNNNLTNINVDFRDFYITAPDDPTYQQGLLEQDDIISVIIQKFKMILFTDQGEVMGDPNFGGNLPELLWQTKVSAQVVETNLTQQINLYIPEIQNAKYTLQVQFVQNPNSLLDIMFVLFKINDYEVFAQIGKFV